MDARPTIRPVAPGDLDALLAYLEEQMKENGTNGVPLFQPYGRATPWRASEKAAPFRDGLATALGAPGWRRVWAAYDEAGAPVGHVDLRAHGEPSTAHRCLLGLGVHRAHRRRGLGHALVQHAVAWATREPTLDWVDLSFLGGNAAAERLYLRAGFLRVATVPDKFRIDGESVDDVLMTLRLRR
jgi:RimJ/RimL family protein N-acetyltransferase